MTDIDITALEPLVKYWFKQWSKAQAPLEPQPPGDAIPEDDPVADEIGLVGVAEFFDSVADFFREVNLSLNYHNYEVNTSIAYGMMVELLDYAITMGLIEDTDDWNTIINAFSERADHFVDSDRPVELPPVNGDPELWSNLFNLFLRHWIGPKSYGLGETVSIDSLTVDRKIQRLRVIVVFLRDYGVFDKSWPWVGKLITDMDEVCKKFRPETGTPSGTVPWSQPDGL